MPSASELFYCRRSRTCRNPDLGFSSSLDQHPHRQQNHHNHHHRHHRRDEDCNPFPRRSSHGPPHARHLFHRVPQTERESIQFDHSISPGTGNSGNGVTLNRTHRPRFISDDRLPGAVLQARARLFERLRGVSVTGNRNSRTDPGISWDEFAVSDGFRIEAESGDWEIEIPEGITAGPPSNDMTVRGGPTSISLYTSNKKPPGLTHEAINSLQQEVFNVAEGDGVLRAEQECCICLESFEKGDVLIHLPCGHMYHPQCLDPWVQACGDCPYCRTGIVVDPVVHRKLQNPL